MKWDSAADQHLLLAILSAHKVTVDHSRVAQIVGCTPRACEERIKKLRKLAKECGYEAQSPALPQPGKRGGKKVGKGGKVGKEKYMDNMDMILYRKGIVLDDIEVKMEDEMMIKKEIIKKEFRMSTHDVYGYGYGYGYGEDAKPLIKQQKMEGSPLFTGNRGIRNSRSPLMPYANTAAGLEIPLGVPLEIACEPIVCGGRTYDFNNHTALLVKGCQKPQERSTSSPRIGCLAHVDDAEFIEISPASKKDPLVINDDCEDISSIHQAASSSCIL